MIGSRMQTFFSSEHPEYLQYMGRNLQIINIKKHSRSLDSISYNSVFFIYYPMTTVRFWGKVPIKKPSSKLLL